MNHLREEHRIQLSTRYAHRDSFTSLWDHIARQHHFVKLTFPFSHRSPTTTEIEDALAHRSGSVSPYSTRPMGDYQIIYDKKGTLLLTNRMSLPTLGTFFATEDTDASHRYFVGFAFRVGPLTESITGMVVYFDEQGHCDSDRAIICPRVLATYDQRNGLLRSANTFLYHQTLLFIQTHRDTRKLMMYVSYVPYETEIVEDHVYYYTEIELPYDALFRETIQAHQRFLHIPKRDATTLLLDMGSLTIAEEAHRYNEEVEQRHRYFLFDTYTLYEKAYVPSFLEVAHLFPEKEYSDGYPLFCIRCHEQVVAATYTAKTTPLATTQCGLGSGYCPDCRIRFSHSKDAWVCAEIRLDGTICHGFLLEHGECQAGHLHSADQTLMTLLDAPLLKYPFRQKIQIQWLPSEEALICARTTKILAEDLVLRQRTSSFDQDDHNRNHHNRQEDEDEDDDLFKEEPEVL